MNNRKSVTKAYSEVLNIWRNYAQEESTEHLKVDLEIHKKLLNYFQIGDFYYYIFNLTTKQLEFVSPGIEKVLGYTPEETTPQSILGAMLPEDAIQFVNNENEALKFLSSLPKDKLLKYKVQGDYRFYKKTGETVRILHQAVVIGQYSDGSPSHSLGIHTDISHIKLNGTPVLSFIGLDSEPSFVDVKVDKPLIKFKGALSSRERDVINLLAKGKSYKEIAAELFISTETVRRHLHNIYKKLNVKSNIEAINVALGSNNLLGS